MTTKAFTLVELMIVLIIMSILASWGIPQYTRTVARAKARNAMNNLVMLHSANLLYQARNGGANFDCTAMAGGCSITNIDDMNGANSLNIISGGVTYVCNGATCSGAIAGSFNTSVRLTDPIQEGTDTDKDCADATDPNPCCLSATNVCP